MAANPGASFTATYSSPDNAPFSITDPIAGSASTLSSAAAGVHDKTQYLSNLRDAVSSAQARINKELTDRMEEDKARQAASGSETAAAAAEAEAKEEENYGEDVQGEED